MRACWANSLGGCGGGFSGEHIVSKGLFSGKAVQVQGSPWRTQKPKTIGIGSLTANILCRNHNSALSAVDQEGIAAFHAIRGFEEILSGRSPPADSTALQANIDGPLLERWFIKHAINLFVVAGKQKHWQGGATPIDPPATFVKAAYGLYQLPKPLGLYNWVGQLGERKVVGDQVLFMPQYDVLGHFVGAAFEFQALSFLIWMSEELPSPFVRDFYHHVGGIFQAPPVRASFNVLWP